MSGPHYTSPAAVSRPQSKRRKPDPHDECETDLVAALTEIEHLQSSLAAAYDRIELQDLVIREVDHRAKNAFLTTAGLLRLQEKDTVDRTASDLLQRARMRLMTLAAAHSAMVNLGADDLLSLDDLIRAICESMSNGVAVPECGDGRIKLALDLAAVKCPAVQATPLALLASEALTNALKHAFPDGRGGSVLVRLWRGEQTITLSVSDDGRGGSARVVGGQGSVLMKRVARHLRADLSIIKRPQGGREIRISMNLPEAGA